MIERPWNERVLSARTKLGLTQAQFARKLGMSQQNLGLWETRATRPYSLLAEYFVKVEAIIEKMVDGEEVRWIGPDDMEDNL